MRAETCSAIVQRRFQIIPRSVLKVKMPVFFFFTPPLYILAVSRLEKDLSGSWHGLRAVQSCANIFENESFYKDVIIIINNNNNF